MVTSLQVALETTKFTETKQETQVRASLRHYLEAQVMICSTDTWETTQSMVDPVRISSTYIKEMIQSLEEMVMTPSKPAERKAMT